jgi:D-xylonolactonase
VETLVPERRMVGGLALRQDGGFIMTGPNVAHWRDGEVRVLLERDGVNSFNDCHTDQQGRLYVGAIRSDLDDLKAAKTSGECYRINLDGNGAVSNRRMLEGPSFLRGIPDGMCLEADGNLWVVHVGGRRVVQLSPTGEEIGEIAVPAKAVTSVAFGGPDMGDLYIVTVDNLDDEDKQGSIFHTRPVVVGLPTPLAAV